MRGRLLLIGSLLIPSTAAAQSSRIIDHWSVDAGLPNNALADVVQSREGYLWIATWAGVVRFDGVRFTAVASNLPNDHARALFEDKDGAMWVGVAGTGLARWRDGQVDSFTTARGLAGQDVRAIVQDGSGCIWAGTENGVSIIEAGGIRTLRGARGMLNLDTHILLHAVTGA